MMESVIKFIIGFSNLDERNAFPIAVREGLEQAASQYPDIQLIVRNNDLNTDLAKQHIREFADVPVDLAMIFHVDERAGFNMIQPLHRKNIPIISIEMPYPLTYFFGVDNVDMGQQAGHVVGNWIRSNWNGYVDKVLIATASGVIGEIPGRFEAALNALTGYVPVSRDQILYLDSEMERAVIQSRVVPVLEQWKEYQHIVVICINDYVASGILAAARQVGREQDIAVLSYDGTPVAFEEFARPFSRLLVSPAFYPEKYGGYLIDLALKILHGEKVPRQNFIKAQCLTRENYQDHLPERTSDD